MDSAKSKKLTFIILFAFIFLFLVGNIHKVSANGDTSFEINTEFEMTEYSISEGDYSNVNDIDFELPSSTWEIDDIEFNFTDVEFGLEMKIIEDKPSGTNFIDKFHDGYGIQIVIEDPTIIYSVLVYGNNESTETVPLYVQIHGYDNVTNFHQMLLFTGLLFC